ncbi:hypothetical protein pdam_00025356 [Pocillopora damicornis]|uniref:Fe2OG dioxygenase domain-containing protein n=1 Tax=Pocillopora damicornis TaxID=46731 RepID=A0A3M6UDA0_POCDA|nr:hypothetical protein pdam_00025356 [Pocillopora damicornis]
MADEPEHFVCQCFFTHNIFLNDYEAHVTFKSKVQFENEYRKALYHRGCTTDEQWQEVLKQVEDEIERRKKLGRDSQRRKKIIITDYKPLHPDVYILQESFLADNFLSLVHYARDDVTATADGLLSMIKHCDGKPNTMNNFGVLLNELGFDENFFSPLRTNYLMPITRLLYPECGGNTLDSHKAFTVHYKIGEDLDLSYHYDNAEVTLNVSLGKEFVGGELFFGDMRQVPLRDTECTQCEHVTSYGLLHRGQHMHGALPIQSGERINLIIWMRSSVVRNKLCPMCGMEPRLMPCSGEGDGFTTGNSVPVCSAL